MWLDPVENGSGARGTPYIVSIIYLATTTVIPCFRYRSTLVELPVQFRRFRLKRHPEGGLAPFANIEHSTLLQLPIPIFCCLPALLCSVLKIGSQNLPMWPSGRGLRGQSTYTKNKPGDDCLTMHHHARV